VAIRQSFGHARLFKDIDLGTITTSMTINSRRVMLALFVAQAEESGVAQPARRHVQKAS